MIIWLASYPRSGNTFLRATLNSAFGLKSKSIHGDNSDIGQGNDLAGIVGHVMGAVSESDVARLRREPDVHLIKTHHVPSHYMDVGDRVIYIMRDGRDSIVSYYHYLLRIAGNSSVSLRHLAMGMAGFGLWARHVRDWEGANFQKKSVFRYEDMVRDSGRLIADLAEALGREPVSQEVPQFEVLKGINSNFFRKGKVGSWSDELGGTDEKLFWLYNGSMMIRHGYTDRIPPDMEALIAEKTLSDFFEEHGYNSKRELDQYRRAVNRRDAAAARQPKAPPPVRQAAATTGNGATPPVKAVPIRKTELAPVESREVDQRTEASDVQWYVGQVLAGAVRRRDARSLFRFFMDGRSRGTGTQNGKDAGAADLGWLANSVLRSKRSLTIPITPAPDFDEEAYLERYSDVRRAVREGRISCGFAHYVHFGRLENRDRPAL